MNDIDKIWESLAKPKEYEKSKIFDFFDFEFASLPHYVLQRKEFDVAVTNLKQRYNLKSLINFQIFGFKTLKVLI